jgi:hypothetical protein
MRTRRLVRADLRSPALLRAVTIAGCASIIWPVAGAAQIPIGLELQVNTETTGTQFAFRRAVASDAAGNFVVTWSAADGAGSGVFARRFDTSAPEGAAEFRVNAYTGGLQDHSTVASDSAGQLVFVWESRLQDGSEKGVYARRFDAAGAPLGGEFRVNTFTTGSQHAADLSTDGQGNFVVVWTDEPGPGFPPEPGHDGSGQGVFGQRYDAAGSPTGAEFRVNSYTTGDQAEPSVAKHPNGDFVVVWEGLGEGPGYEIFGQRYDADGGALGLAFQVNTTPGSHLPEVAVAASGAFLIVWSHVGTGGVAEVRARRYDPAGVPLGPDFQVNSYTTGRQDYVDVASDADGNFVVVWTSDGGDGDGQGIFGQRYDRTGAARGTEFAVNAFTTSNQRFPGLATDATGHFVVGWSSYGQDGSGWGTFARRFIEDVIFDDGFDGT